MNILSILLILFVDTLKVPVSIEIKHDTVLIDTSKGLINQTSTNASAVRNEKDIRKAVGLSLLLPGLGERYMGEKEKALRGFICEGSIWALYGGFKIFASILKDNYILHAHANSGAVTNGDEKYYDAVEWYKSIDDYNEYIREEARYYYPNDREKQKKYEMENFMPNSVAWKWDNDKLWEEYRNLRKGRRRVLQNASFCVGGAVLNRIISAIIIFTTKGENLQYNFEFVPENKGFCIYFTKKF